ncbi:MAG: hypothetical protein JWO36_5009, partial [Myxococcales bacterium]|nr:hypothetical protein [Myxococcales bacterium]
WQARCTPRCFLVLALVVLGGWAPAETLPGWGLYDRLCVACHGTDGDGRGPAAPYTWGRPRAFVRGTYLWRSTSFLQPPTDDDLRTTIGFGAPGSSMPGFGDVLAPAEIDQLIAIVKAFSPDTFAVPPSKLAPQGFSRAKEARPRSAAGSHDLLPSVVPLGPPPPRDPVRGAKLFGQWCAACHGTGAGDGPSAFALAIKPYPLVSVPLRRPRASEDRDVVRAAAAHSIATGLAGTPMGGFSGKLPDDDLWALADRVLEINARARDQRGVIDPEAIALDRASPIAAGTWPGAGELSPFGGAIEPQGPPPPSLAPAQASLDAQQCARCHVKQVREWEPSVHRGAGSPGFLAQTIAMPTPQRAACLRCHAPLPEQAADGVQGVSCAGCHVRAWTRLGPPKLATSLLPIPAYPLVTLASYERSDFCLPCHQSPPRTAAAGKPLLDTYREWLESPYMRRGMQCQHCHMANREHAMLGIHDPQTLRQGIELAASAHRKDGTVTVLASLRNIGAGHALPTTATPVVILRIELYDARGRAIEGARSELRIGRDLDGDLERSDTRIMPGEQATLARAWTAGRVSEAVTAKITVEVHPDAAFEQPYAKALAGPLPQAQRALYEQALAKGRASHYLAEQREVTIANP